MNKKNICEDLSLEKCTINYFLDYLSEIEDYCYYLCSVHSEVDLLEVNLKILNDDLDLNEENYKNISTIYNIYFRDS